MVTILNQPDREASSRGAGLHRVWEKFEKLDLRGSHMPFRAFWQATL